VIAERVPHQIVVEPIDDSTCFVSVRSNSVEMLAVYLGLLDADFTVTEPLELVEQLAKLSRRYAAASA
jgi:hypothetical protein